jgi:hypothetical protein
MVPRVFDQIDETPRSFHFVAPRKQGGVAAHRVEQKPLIRFGRGFAKARAVMKIHFDRLDAHGAARTFRLDPQRNAFIRLNANDEHIRAALLRVLVE